MATVVWNTVTVGSGNWNTAADWVGGTVPTTNDDVQIPGTGALAAFTVTYDVASSPPALSSLTIGDGSSAPITLAVGANTLNVTGSGTKTIALAEAGGA